MSLWIGLAIAACLLLLGFLGLVGGLLVVLQQVRRRSALKASRARRAAMAAALPTSSTQVYSASTRPTVPMMESPLARPPGPAPVTASPTLLPDVDEFDDEVPTGVFRPAQISEDIDVMLKEADKYVSTHRKGG